LTDLFGASDAHQRRRRTGLGGACAQQSDEDEPRGENGRKFESHSGVTLCQTTYFSAAAQLCASWQFWTAPSVACSDALSALESDENVLCNSFGSVARS